VLETILVFPADKQLISKRSLFDLAFFVNRDDQTFECRLALKHCGFEGGMQVSVRGLLQLNKTKLPD
jgi:hypothetical protein